MDYDTELICDTKSKILLLAYLQLNGDHFIHPYRLNNRSTFYNWTTDYQLKKALKELENEGKITRKLCSRGWYRWYAYKAHETITIDDYRVIQRILK